MTDEPSDSPKALHTRRFELTEAVLLRQGKRKRRMLVGGLALGLLTGVSLIAAAAVQGVVVVAAAQLMATGFLALLVRPVRNIWKKAAETWGLPRTLQVDLTESQLTVDFGFVRTSVFEAESARLEDGAVRLYTGEDLLLAVPLEAELSAEHIQRWLDEPRQARPPLPEAIFHGEHGPLNIAALANASGRPSLDFGLLIAGWIGLTAGSIGALAAPGYWEPVAMQGAGLLAGYLAHRFYRVVRPVTQRAVAARYAITQDAILCRTRWTTVRAPFTEIRGIEEHPSLIALHGVSALYLPAVAFEDFEAVSDFVRARVAGERPATTPTRRAPPDAANPFAPPDEEEGELPRAIGGTIFWLTVLGVMLSVLCLGPTR